MFGILAVYAGMDYAVDTQNQPAAKRYGRVQGLRGQLAAASAFVGPELLAIGEEIRARLACRGSAARVSEALRG